MRYIQKCGVPNVRALFNVIHNNTLRRPEKYMHGEMASIEPVVLVHGGAGDIPKDKTIETEKIKGVKCAARIGYCVLAEGGTAVDAVEAAVRSLEGNPIFNSGYGAVLNIDGEVALDASIMDGSNLEAGCVALVQNIKHPVSLARLVMEKCPHTFLAGVGANRFAEEQGVETVPPGSLITESATQALELFKKSGGNIFARPQPTTQEFGEPGTVGAVAIDKNGHLAAATSTGGTTGKLVGRVGDSPLIGSGTYADDNLGAVSVTGHGESIMKYCLSHSIVKMLNMCTCPKDATMCNLQSMTNKFNNMAGAIALTKKGQIGIGFTTDRMSWAYQRKNEVHYGLDKDQDDVEKL